MLGDFSSFQDLEHEGEDTRSQGGIKIQDKIQRSHNQDQSKPKTINQYCQEYQVKDQDPKSQAWKRNFKRIPKNDMLQDFKTHKKEIPQLNDHPLGEIVSRVFY
ncbi:hypothetical protein Tco_1045510 [Tanacetum coccineum]|uniref:Uncharacterized protein n=1 Tax=Tanacetum coccineum TaxID=301880 RepID=A0ABQ5GT38_9ASTR